MSAEFPYTAWHLGRTGKPRSVSIVDHVDENQGWMYPMGVTADAEYHRLTELYPSEMAALKKAIQNLKDAEERNLREAKSIASHRAIFEKLVDDLGESQ